MIIGFPKETNSGETRVVLIPSFIKKYINLGYEILVEAGYGLTSYHDDNKYKEAGAKIVAEKVSLLDGADIVARISKPELSEIRYLKKGCVHVSHLDPFHEKPLIKALTEQGVTAVSVEMIPRSTRAQKMDFLSSQASLAGYMAVVLAAARLPQIFPMMTTPAGTITPARVFIIGAGVAGLQAIATAKRLGAPVEAFDTRSVVEEQVKSLGAKFVKIDIGETGQTKDGYAKELTPEQMEKQREGMVKKCAQSDVVITTAQVFGKKAPLIVTDEMIRAMKPGSVIVDLAVDNGGNVEGSRAGEEVILHGIKVLGFTNLPGHIPLHASQMLASNMFNFIEEFTDKTTKQLKLDLADEILKSCVITHGGRLVHEGIGGL